MNKNINLCNILKGHEGETFYSRCFGNIIIKNIDLNYIIFSKNLESKEYIFFKNGKYFPDGEIDLFPSKYQQDWNKWIEEQNNNKTPKTWNELLHNRAEYLFNKDKRNDYCIDITGHNCLGYTKYNTPIEKSALALLKIHQLIEAGYGGNITNKEWDNHNIFKYIICFDHLIGVNKFNIVPYTNEQNNIIVFHTEKQAEEFLSYSDNVQLLKDYFMINN